MRSKVLLVVLVLAGAFLFGACNGNPFGPDDPEPPAPPADGVPQIISFDLFLQDPITLDETPITDGAVITGNRIRAKASTHLPINVDIVYAFRLYKEENGDWKEISTSEGSINVGISRQGFRATFIDLLIGSYKVVFFIGRADNGALSDTKEARFTRVAT